MKTLLHDHTYDDFDDMNKAFLKLQRTLVELQDLSHKVSADSSNLRDKSLQEQPQKRLKTKWERTKDFFYGGSSVKPNSKE